MENVSLEQILKIGEHGVLVAAFFFLLKWALGNLNSQLKSVLQGMNDMNETMNTFLKSHEDHTRMLEKIMERLSKEK